MGDGEFIKLCLGLDSSGLVWHPEIGDEVSERTNLHKVSILVDPHGLSPYELRQSFLWLPTVEQLVQQFEERQAFIYHAGVAEDLTYEAVIKTKLGVIEASAPTLRAAFGRALFELLSQATTVTLH